MNRKTKKMMAVEEKFHQSLENMLPEMVTENGLSSTADELGVSKATLGYWLLKLGITVRRISPRRVLRGKASSLTLNQNC